MLVSLEPEVYIQKDSRETVQYTFQIIQDNMKKIKSSSWKYSKSKVSLLKIDKTQEFSGWKGLSKPYPMSTFSACVTFFIAQTFHSRMTFVWNSTIFMHFLKT